MNIEIFIAFFHQSIPLLHSTRTPIREYSSRTDNLDGIRSCSLYWTHYENNLHVRYHEDLIAYLRVFWSDDTFERFGISGYAAGVKYAIFARG